MGSSKKLNDRLDDLLALQRKHAQSARECPECGKRPLSSKDPLGAVFVVDADTGMCRGCVALLNEADAEYVECWLPRGIDEATKPPAEYYLNAFFTESL